MRTILISALCLLLAGSIMQAQTVSGRKKGLQAETSFVFAGASHWTLGARQVLGYNITPDWFAGLGTGFISNLNPDANNVNLVPLYATGRWYWKDRRWSPFLDMSAGYVFAVGRNNGGGVYVAPLIGINYHIKGRLSLDMGLGYLYQGCTYSGEAFNQHSPEIRLGLRY